MKTRRDLVDAALENLGVLASGQVAEQEDIARVNARVETTIDDLRARDVIYIPDADEFDPEIFEDLAVCLANTCRLAFGLAENPRLPAAVLRAEDNLRTKSAQGPVYSVLKTVYY